MGDAAIDSKDIVTTASGEERTKSRVARYDQVYDTQTSQVRLIKSIKNAKKQSSSKNALVVRRLIDDKGFHTKTEVDIKSNRVAEVMRAINSEVEEISLRTTPPVVPLELFYHNKKALRAKLDEASKAETIDEVLVADLTVAVKFAEEEYATETASLDQLLASGEITWELLWTIFAPNVLVYRHHRLVEQDQIMKLRAIRQVKRLDKSRYWELDCHIVADDGVKFGLAYEPFLMQIEEFIGARKITDLRIFPLQYHVSAVELRQMALERGRRFAGIGEVSLMQTSGPAMFEQRDRNYKPRPYKFNTHGRAIIDSAGFRMFNPNLAFMPDVHRGLIRTQLTDEQFIICTPVAFGFCFGNKKWGGFAMSRLLDITWNDHAFQELVLDKQTKMLVHSLVKQHSSEGDGFDDIIAGKGKGLIGLFSGPPGCGKTLTAEAVAEITKRPLYSVSAGDLGTDSQSVDKKLSEILEQAHKWNAVLLLDEADVFLQQRDQHSIVRNALVSIFLRQLEYFQGILILTTNRIAHCDTAFKSRIHISIQYPDLDQSARRQLWNTFLDRVREIQDGVEVDISEEEVSQVAKIKANGRQIKIIVGSARTLAREMNEKLSIAHINLVLSVHNVGHEEELPIINGTHKGGVD